MNPNPPPTAQNQAVQSFNEFTGNENDTRARHLLEMCNWDVQHAVNVFYMQDVQQQLDADQHEPEIIEETGIIHPPPVHRVSHFARRREPLQNDFDFATGRYRAHQEPQSRFHEDQQEPEDGDSSIRVIGSDSNNDVQMLDAEEPKPPQISNGRAATQAGVGGSDEVRAPIPAKRGIMLAQSFKETYQNGRQKAANPFFQPSMVSGDSKPGESSSSGEAKVTGTGTSRKANDFEHMRAVHRAAMDKYHQEYGQKLTQDFHNLNANIEQQWQKQQENAGNSWRVSFAPTEEMASTESNGGANKQVYKLVLTGGPCGGKTSALPRLRAWFEQYGWKVFTVPETASILLNGGIKFDELGPEQAFEFQRGLLRTLIQIEQVYFSQARMITDRNVLIICDRGALDPSAYMPKEEWELLMKKEGMTKSDLFGRYNQVVHMVTAADGASQYYTCANNSARRESMEEALKQDRRTREAWIGHQCLSIVDNTDCRNFNEKIMKLIKVVTERLERQQTQQAHPGPSAARQNVRHWADPHGGHTGALRSDHRLLLLPTSFADGGAQSRDGPDGPKSQPNGGARSHPSRRGNDHEMGQDRLGTNKENNMMDERQFG